jgi:hypothetical protein
MPHPAGGECPPVSWSRTAISSASRSGSYIGSTWTSAPIRIVVVRWDSAARNRFGDGQTDSGVPWCSVTW